MNKNAKVYTLADGTQWTVDKLSEFLPNIKRSTLATRLSVTNDPKKVLNPIVQNNTTRERREDVVYVSKRIKKRMYYDPLGHWSLINKCV